MPLLVFLKLIAIFVTIAIGWLAGRTAPFRGGEAARILSNAAFYVFAPALLFRATARIDFQTLPWRALAVFFVPVVCWMLAVYLEADLAQFGRKQFTYASRTRSKEDPVVGAGFVHACPGRSNMTRSRGRTVFRHRPMMR